MKVVQMPDEPRIIYLMAETEEDKVVIESLHICKENSVKVSRVYEEEVGAKLIDGVAMFTAVTEYLSGDPEARACRTCRVNRDTHEVNICEPHRIKWQELYLKNLAKIELVVPCTCAGLEAYMGSYNPATGHGKDCLVPILQKTKRQVPS